MKDIINWVESLNINRKAKDIMLSQLLPIKKGWWSEFTNSFEKK